jgi:hypothetical protein
LSLPLGSKLVCQEGSKADFPVPDHFVRELEASFQEHFGKITKAQLIPDAPEDDEENDVGREFKIIEIPPTTLPLSIRVFHPWNTSPSPIPLIRSTLSPCRVLASPPTPSLVLPVSSPSHPASNA